MFLYQLEPPYPLAPVRPEITPAWGGRGSEGANWSWRPSWRQPGHQRDVIQSSVLELKTFLKRTLKVEVCYFCLHILTLNNRTHNKTFCADSALLRPQGQSELHIAIHTTPSLWAPLLPPELGYDDPHHHGQHHHNPHHHNPRHYDPHHHGRIWRQ